MRFLTVHVRLICLFLPPPFSFVCVCVCSFVCLFMKSCVNVMKLDDIVHCFDFLKNGRVWASHGLLETACQLSCVIVLSNQGLATSPHCCSSSVLHEFTLTPTQSYHSSVSLQTSVSLVRSLCVHTPICASVCVSPCASVPARV